MPHPRLDHAAMLAAYVAGVPVAQIHPRWPSYVSVLARKAGLKPRLPRITPEQKQRIVDDYLADVPVSQIWPANPRLVYDVLRERGLRPQRYKDRPWLLHARRMRAAGATFKQIAAELEVSNFLVRTALREAA